MIYCPGVCNRTGSKKSFSLTLKGYTMHKAFRIICVVLGFIAIIAYYFWRSELWDFQRLRGRYAQYARGGMFDGASPHMSPNGRKIVFAIPSSGRSDIYCSDHDGSNRQQLTSSTDYEGFPIYSPDGKKIAYLREDANAIAHVWVMDANGGNQQQLTNNSFEDMEPVFTSDNKSVVFTRRGRFLKMGIQDYLFKVSLPDKNEERLSLSEKEEDHITFDSKGGRLYASDGPPPGLWVASKNGKPAFIGEGRLWPCLSPDGTKIVFVINEEPRNLCIMNRDGTDMHSVYVTPDYIKTCSFSPDGQKVLLEQITNAGSKKIGDAVLVDLRTKEVAHLFSLK